MADLSLSELQAFDPTAKGSGRERRFCCPFCGDAKPKDSAHRSLGVNMGSGVWNCHRCGEKGLLFEFRSEKREQNPTRTPKQAARKAVSRAFALRTLRNPSRSWKTPENGERRPREPFP